MPYCPHGLVPAHPVSERVGKQIVTLPLFPTMNETDVERVVSAVKSCLSEI